MQAYRTLRGAKTKRKTTRPTKPRLRPAWMQAYRTWHGPQTKRKQNDLQIHDGGRHGCKPARPCTVHEQHINKTTTEATNGTNDRGTPCGEDDGRKHNNQTSYKAAQAEIRYTKQNIKTEQKTYRWR